MLYGKGAERPGMEISAWWVVVRMSYDEEVSERYCIWMGTGSGAGGGDIVSREVGDWMRQGEMLYPGGWWMVRDVVSRYVGGR